MCRHVVLHSTNAACWCPLVLLRPRSTRPFFHQITAVFVQLLTFEEARAALASTEYPLFVQVCRPPLVFITEPAYPVVKLLCNLVLTNRSVEKVVGEFRCDGHKSTLLVDGCDVTVL